MTDKDSPPDDWRRQGQEIYLRGKAFEFRPYSADREGWDHDHCAFCWAKFSASGEGDLRSGYVTVVDNYHWVCEECFADFKGEMEFSVSVSE